MEMAQGAKIIVEQWLHLKQGQFVYYVTDETHSVEATIFKKACDDVLARCEVILLHSSTIQQGDVIENLKWKFGQADAIVGATNYSFITTDAVNYALSRGAQFLSLPMATNNGESLFCQEFLKMDPDEATMIGMPMFWALRNAKRLRVTTKCGTDLTLSIEDRSPGIFHGSLWDVGKCSSSSFEIYIPPQEYKTNGTLVVDGSMGYLGLVKEPLKIDIVNGYIQSIENTDDGRRLKTYIDAFGDLEMYCAAEFGIGLNTIAKCAGRCYIEDESAYGTFHIGFGRNLALGGSHHAKGHFDLVSHGPNIYVDDKVIMENGIAKKVIR